MNDQISYAQATREFEVRNILVRHCGEMLSPDKIDAVAKEFFEAMSTGPCAWSFDTAKLTAEVEALQKQLGECSGGYQTLEKEVEALRKRGKFALGDRVAKINGAHWYGRVVGTYSTTLTPEGYCVESAYHMGSVQIYPAAALKAVGAAPMAARPGEKG